jgi:hypothetical protein
MKEELISFETAKLLTHTDFPQKTVTDGYVITTGELSYDYVIDYINGRAIQAPTQSLLQKWLREKHNLHISIHRLYECSKSPAVFEGYNVYIAGPTFETEYKINHSYFLKKYFKSYEEALEIGILEALKLIKS